MKPYLVLLVFVLAVLFGGHCLMTHNTLKTITIERIVWKSDITGFIGHGNWFNQPNSLLLAVHEANIKWPEIKHFIEQRKVRIPK